MIALMNFWRIFEVTILSICFGMTAFVESHQPIIRIVIWECGMAQMMQISKSIGFP